jgi:hypothetical protein
MFRVGLISLSLIAPVGAAGRASAGWLTIKNETNQPVVLQETVAVNNQVRRGKPIRLMPGEVLREYQSGNGTKSISVLECGGQKRTLCTHELTWTRNDHSFAVRKDGGSVQVLAADNPSKTVSRTETTRRK